MDDFDNSLDIPVTYRGTELSFPAKLVLSGFTHKIQVEVDGLLVLFEPDEERNYRAILPETALLRGTRIDTGLLQAIAAVLESVAK